MLVFLYVLPPILMHSTSIFKFLLTKTKVWITNMAFIKHIFYKIIIALGILTGAYCLFSPSSKTIENVSSYAIYPILHSQQLIVDTLNTWIKNRKNSAQLKNLLDKAQQECEALRAENIQLLATQKYMTDIEEIDMFRKKYVIDHSRIAHIIFRHFSPKEHYFLVDAGMRHGIQQDMIAVYKNCLVGKVEHVYAWYSKIRLITDASCKVAAYCATTKINGIYQGCNEHNNALLQYVPHFEPIKLNDLIVSSGEGIIFPQGFSLGSIASYQQDGLHHTICVKPHIDLPSLSYCVLMAR